MILPYLAITLLLVVTAYSALVSFRQAGSTAPPTWIFPARAQRPTRIGVGIFTIALLVGVTISLTSGARHAGRHPYRFLVPEGYVGWARVDFEVNDAPSLPMEKGEYVVKFRSSGLLRTSSPEEYGRANDHYFYYSDNGTRPLPDSSSDKGRMIWGKINGESSGVQGKKKYEEFFVGTEQQFKQQLTAEPDGNASAPKTSTQ
jgi:uncharacterized protein DUF6843